MRAVSPDWIFELGELAERYALSLPSIRSLTTDLAFAAREFNQRVPNEQDWERVSPASPKRRLVLAYVHGQRMRWDSQFEELRSSCRRWRQEFGADALIIGLEAVAALGLRHPEGLDLYRRALDAPDADERSRHACLAAIWFAHHIQDQPKILLELSDQMITKGEDNWTMYFRRASALRKLGDYEDALDCIDRAIASLPMGHTEVYQEQIRERELITISWGHAQHLSTVDEKLRSDFMHQVEAASEDLTRQVEAASQELAAQADADRADLQRRFNEAQRTVSDSLLKIIEILGLFVALAAFLLGSGAIVLDAGDFSERLGSMALVVVGSLVFFLLLRLTTTYRRR